jgi:hypothetical protein
MTDDANNQITDYLNTNKNYLSPEGKFLSGGLSDTIKMTLINMTRFEPSDATEVTTINLNDIKTYF